MRRIFVPLITGCCLLLSTPALFAKEKNKDLEITGLGGNCYVYTTYGHMDDGSRFPSNSLYLVTDQGIVMLDVPWDTTQTERFIRQVEQKHHKKIIVCISTHFHKDRTGGLDILKRHGIRTYGTTLTQDWCRRRNEQIPEHGMAADTVFDMGNRHLEVFYPGKGHSDDNIVIWVPELKLLYGGCFVKSIDAPGLGNLEDASPAVWAGSVRKVQEKYPQPKFIIPGHGEWNSLKALKHTLDLIGDYLKAHPDIKAGGQQ